MYDQVINLLEKFKNVLSIENIAPDYTREQLACANEIFDIISKNFLYTKISPLTFNIRKPISKELLILAILICRPPIDIKFSEFLEKQDILINSLIDQDNIDTELFPGQGTALKIAIKKHSLKLVIFLIETKKASIDKETIFPYALNILELRYRSYKFTINPNELTVERYVSNLLLILGYFANKILLDPFNISYIIDSLKPFSCPFLPNVLRTTIIRIISKDFKWNSKNRPGTIIHNEQTLVSELQLPNFNNTLAIIESLILTEPLILEDCLNLSVTPYLTDPKPLPLKEMVVTLLPRMAKIKDDNGKQLPPLHCMAKIGYEDIAQFLINNGYDVNAKSGPYDDTPLHLAAQAGHNEMAIMLLQRGANINDVNLRNTTPLDSAVYYGYNKARYGVNSDVAKTLLKNGATHAKTKTIKVNGIEFDLAKTKYIKVSASFLQPRIISHPVIQATTILPLQPSSHSETNTKTRIEKER